MDRTNQDYSPDSAEPRSGNPEGGSETELQTNAGVPSESPYRKRLGRFAHCSPSPPWLGSGRATGIIESEGIERAGCEERVLILAPLGRDAEVARQTICRAGMSAEVCSDIDDVCRELGEGAGVVLLTQEGLGAGALERLFRTLDSQPAWSDLPLVILVSKESAASRQLAERLGERANATFLERPVGAATLIRAVQMALRARRRQYELRERLVALEQAEAMEREALARAEEANHIRDEFLASVAHDLKNPLGAIKGFAQLLQRRVLRPDAPQPAKLAEQLGRIDGMAARAIAQIDQLLDAARLQAGQPLPLDLAPADLVGLAHRVVAEWQEASPSDRVHIVTELPELHGVWDPQRLERALSNLLANAVKYSPEGGEVTVRLEHQARSAVLTVQDEGIGIPPNDLPNVFRRFYRASNASHFPGTGLGLFGVRQIVEQHGGSITIESKEGRGTRVVLRLPTVRGELEE